ncbi:uncharacterized protein LOC136026896 [Artemia franciscana]|uniref:Uncharacterized protein n=1 Tax=Artemia franciscana TaxID=6661 RepID=A0AA88KYW6_ARTSF|nr:hypothetical protein QYM36_013550 [Artemia franciscana]
MEKLLLLTICLGLVKGDVYEEFGEFPTSVWYDDAPSIYFPTWSKEHYSGYPLPPPDDKTLIEMVRADTTDETLPAYLRSVPFYLDGENDMRIRYWLRSANAGGSKLRVQISGPDGRTVTIKTIQSSSDYNNNFVEESILLPTRTDGQYSIIIQGEREVTDEGGVGIGAIYLIGSNFVEPTTTTLRTTVTDGMVSNFTTEWTESTELTDSTSENYFSSTPDTEITDTTEEETYPSSSDTTLDSSDIPTESPTSETTYETDSTSEENLTSTPDIEATDATDEETYPSPSETATPDYSDFPTESSTSGPVSSTYSTDYPTEEFTESSTVQVETTKPSTVQTEPTTELTTPAPNGPIVYNFTTNNNNGWSPSRRNGAYWLLSNNNEMVPSSYETLFRLYREQFYTGPVPLTSPFFQITQEKVEVEIEFWGNGNRDNNARLHFFTKDSFNNISADPFFDMSTFVNRPSTSMVKVSTSFMGNVGDELQLMVQAALGQSKDSTIAISYLKITGVIEVSYPGSSGALDDRGWTQGESSGCHWLVIHSSDEGRLEGVPPFSGTALGVDRYISRPGMATIESPLIQNSDFRQEIRMTFYLRGQTSCPADLTLRVKTSHGVLDDVPFLDTRSFSTTELTDWISVTADLPPSASPFQVVIEALVGYEPRNTILISELWLTTYAADGSVVDEKALF